MFIISSAFSLESSGIAWISITVSETVSSSGGVFEQVEFFVDAVSDYKSDFVLFPEYFNAPLMSKYNDKGEDVYKRQGLQWRLQPM